MRKPPFVSHYLVLNDLIAEVDVRKFSDNLTYLTSRIENIKLDLVNRGLLFNEEAKAQSRYSSYKPYVLIRSVENIENAKRLLSEYETEAVQEFLANTARIAS